MLGRSSSGSAVSYASLRTHQRVRSMAIIDVPAIGSVLRIEYLWESRRTRLGREAGRALGVAIARVGTGAR